MTPCTRFQLIRSNILTNPVENNLILKELTIKLDDSLVACVKYELIADGTYDLIHSSIPEEYQGLGLGRILAERVFDYLEEKRTQFTVTCEFLQKCLAENNKTYTFCQ